MSRLIILLTAMVLALAVAVALKSCDQEPIAVTAAGDNASDIVALDDGVTMLAPKGTVGRKLVDWLASNERVSPAYDLGGNEFVGDTAEPTPLSWARIPRLVAMLEANPDVMVQATGYAADRTIAAARAKALVDALEQGGISAERLGSRGEANPPGTPASHQISIVLSRPATQ